MFPACVYRKNKVCVGTFPCIALSILPTPVYIGNMFFGTFCKCMKYFSEVMACFSIILTITILCVSSKSYLVHV